MFKGNTKKTQTVKEVENFSWLMMVLKHFNLPFSPPPTRGSGKERVLGGGQGVAVHRLAAAAQSIKKPPQFMNTFG